MASETLQIRFECSVDGINSALTAAEIGVLLIAINRAINGIVGEAPDSPASWMPLSRSTDFAGEPSLVQLSVQRVQQGSLILEVVPTLAAFAGPSVAPFMAHVAADMILLLIAKSGKRMVKEIGRGFRRIAASMGQRSYRIAIQHGANRKVYTAHAGGSKGVIVDTLPDDALGDQEVQKAGNATGSNPDTAEKAKGSQDGGELPQHRLFPKGAPRDDKYNW